MVQLEVPAFPGYFFSFLFFNSHKITVGKNIFRMVSQLDSSEVSCHLLMIPGVTGSNNLFDLFCLVSDEISNLELFSYHF